MHPVNIFAFIFALNLVLWGIQILTIRYFTSFGFFWIPCVLYPHSIQSYLRTHGFSVQGVPKNPKLLK